MPAVVSAATRFKLIFLVPPSFLEACKAAIFAVGAGRYPGQGNYTECCWTTIGTGQFRPGDTANPHIGTVGALEQVQEARVETLCISENVARKAVEALKKCVRIFTCCFPSTSSHIKLCVCRSHQGCPDNRSRAHPYEEPAYEVFKLEDF